MMSRHRSLLLLASFALAALLLIVLIKISKIDLHVTIHQLQAVRLVSFLKIALLNAILVVVSTEKWRSIDAALRHPTDSVQSRATSFALTSAGLALGALLPVQLAMSTARTLGTYFHGSPIKRGTAGTLLEQGFDVLTTLFLAIGSALTWLLRGGGWVWLGTATMMTIVTLAAVAPSIRFIRWALTRFVASTEGEGWARRLNRSVSELVFSGIVSTRLAQRLVMFSVARYVIIVAASIETARAVGLDIPLWQMAAAIPFVTIATLVALTPGAIGVNEFACVGALGAFGTPVTIGTQWALANRVLVVAAYFVIAGCGATVFFARRLATSLLQVKVREY